MAVSHRVAQGMPEETRATEDHHPGRMATADHREVVATWELLVGVEEVSELAEETLGEMLYQAENGGGVRDCQNLAFGVALEAGAEAEVATDCAYAQFAMFVLGRLLCSYMIHTHYPLEVQVRHTVDHAYLHASVQTLDQRID